MSGTHEPTASAPGDPGIGAKVAFLSRPESFPEPTARIETIETHMSWVFLTDRHAWKLKKPGRVGSLDLGSAAARQRNCVEELRLNRRLSSGVYLDVAPLSLDAAGRFRLGANGRPVDWLVRMRRLPADRMLDRMIATGTATANHVRAVATRLAAFYRQAPAVPIDPAAQRASFAAGIVENEQALAAPAYGLPAARVAAVSAWQRQELARLAGELDRRVAAGRIVEGHGDLRPEHVCLEAVPAGEPPLLVASVPTAGAVDAGVADLRPQLIDCLDFSRTLRLLDPADELAYLALECERLGAPELGAPLLAAYAEVTGDVPPPALVGFYRSYRACVRARLALAHLDDPAPREPATWVAKARAYLALARPAAD